MPKHVDILILDSAHRMFLRTMQRCCSTELCHPPFQISLIVDRQEMSPLFIGYPSSRWFRSHKNRTVLYNTHLFYQGAHPTDIRKTSMSKGFIFQLLSTSHKKRRKPQVVEGTQMSWKWEVPPLQVDGKVDHSPWLGYVMFVVSVLNTFLPLQTSFPNQQKNYGLHSW